MHDKAQCRKCRIAAPTKEHITRTADLTRPRNEKHQHRHSTRWRLAHLKSGARSFLTKAVSLLANRRLVEWSRVFVRVRVPCVCLNVRDDLSSRTLVRRVESVCRALCGAWLGLSCGVRSSRESKHVFCCVTHFVFGCRVFELWSEGPFSFVFHRHAFK